MNLFKRPAKSKKQYWYARVRINGRDRWISSKCQVGKYTKEEAEKKIAERLEKLKAAPVSPKAQEPIKAFQSNNPTLYEVAREFVKRKKINNKYSWRSDMYVLNALMIHLGADNSIQEIDEHDVDVLKKALKGTKADTSINQELKVLRSMFNHAIAWGVYGGPNPVSRAGLVEIKDKKKRRQYTKEEIKQLLLFSPKYFKDWINGARWLGMRRTELWKAHESHVNLKGRYIYVPPSKSTDPREVPLEEPAIAMFERLIKHSWNGYLFLNRAGTRFAYPPDEVSKIFNTIRKNSGIKDGCFHSLRHTAASKIINAGGPLTHAQYILGHKNIQTTMIYAHVDEGVRKTASLLYDEDE